MGFYLVIAAAVVVLVASVFFLLRTAPEAAPEEPKAAAKPKPKPTSPAPLNPEDADVFGTNDEVTIVKVQLDGEQVTAYTDEDGELREAVAKAIPIVADAGAEEDEPTHTSAVILVSGAGQTDRGQRRKRNEDRFLRMDSHGIYAVADGMGGYAGGDVASETAVETIAKAFMDGAFVGRIRGDLPRRAAELARALQMANLAIYERAQAEPHLSDMGTTLVATRFSLRKERVYIGHVGDSRCYRIRRGGITQLTTDHTLASLGLTGPQAEYLSRAVGVKPEVMIDVIIAKPLAGDVYLLCSDGLTKMVRNDEEIRDVVLGHHNLDLAAQKLVDLANERGGRDNVTVVLVAVRNPSDMEVPD